MRNGVEVLHGYVEGLPLCYNQCGQCQILLENEINIFKKLVIRRKHEMLQNFLDSGETGHAVGFRDSVTEEETGVRARGQAGLAEECWSQASGGRMASCWQSALGVRWFLLMLVWRWAPLGALSWLLASAERPEPLPFSSLPGKASVAQLDWLLSDKGPFHRCPEYTEFKERFQQGFSTRYKIYSATLSRVAATDYDGDEDDDAAGVKEADPTRS
ncbi:hypothetical protein QTP70_001773 [Hemibagrus guttatus]|uniref:Uncharacterized protein n=1 Tax=Hemibagrus guttatus TaxID=175788 RepID=A0AAE0R694_9TELE|nr:hypothetical protein QTP70_001773 [Hemibagrus guttatus]